MKSLADCMREGIAKTTPAFGVFFSNHGMDGQVSSCALGAALLGFKCEMEGTSIAVSMSAYTDLERRFDILALPIKESQPSMTLAQWITARNDSRELTREEIADVVAKAEGAVERGEPLHQFFEELQLEES